MNRTVIIILTILWFALGMTYYPLVTSSVVNRSVPVQDNLHPADSSTGSEHKSNINLPLYFELDKSLPNKGDTYDQWLNEIRDVIGAKDTLLIVGLYYSGETNGEILATSRSLAVQRMLSEDLDRSRLVVDYNHEVQAAGNDLWVKGISTEIRKLEQAQLLTAEGIRIAFNKGRIKWTQGNSVEKKLSDIPPRLKNSPDYSIKVIAHTSASGTPDADYELGRKRAWIIKKFLIDMGLNADRIKTESKGSEMPEFDNADYEGNDRAIVEVRLSETEQ